MLSVLGNHVKFPNETIYQSIPRKMSVPIRQQRLDSGNRYIQNVYEKIG